MKVAVLSVPHTQTSRVWSTCAFSQKGYSLCKMLYDRGHQVVHLGVEGSDPPCSQNIVVASEADRLAVYGLPGAHFYDTSCEGEQGRYQDRWAAKTRSALLDICRDPYEWIICATWGGHRAQIPAVAGLEQHVVESGIGYPHTFARYRVFESYAWMHMIWGREGRFNGDVWYDCVIPNAFDTDLFTTEANGPRDTFLYIGRLIDSKGVKIAIDTARAVGRKIRIVGQGDPKPFLVGDTSHVEYIGPVGPEARKLLYANALATFVPTRYVEPFGGVAVESMLSGTPVISTDFGVFNETVLHGVTGYRCHTNEQFEWAARNVEKLDRNVCHQWAKQNYSLERVALMYETFFQSILDLKAAGWYQPRPERAELDWLVRHYPVGARV